MVYRLFVQEGPEVQGDEPPKIVPLSSFGSPPETPDTWLEYFNLMTGNFNDLGFFDGERDLHGKSATELQATLLSAIERLRAVEPHAYRPQPDDDDDFCIPAWMWGHVKHTPTTPHECWRPVNLPDNIRRQVLWYHLTQLLKTAARYTDKHYFFIRELAFPD